MARKNANKNDAASTSCINDAGKQNHGDARNRASPAWLVKLYKSMSPDQRKMIDDVGFGGLLEIGTGTLPADLTKWLIRKFDADTSRIIIPGRGSLIVSEESVHRILGLPMKGDKVVFDLNVAAINFIHEKYELDSGKAHTMKSIVKWLQDNKEADEDYLRSWLMLAVSTFLCPNTALFISPRCYPALVDLTKVKGLNWCAYVVDSLKGPFMKCRKEILYRVVYFCLW